MAGNNIRRNFVGDNRGCSKCGGAIVVTEVMVRNRSYMCGRCHVTNASRWAGGNRDRKRQLNNQYQARHSDQRAEQTARWRGAHPEKRAAHNAVQTALRNGDLTREPCSVCGATRRIHAHHDDYSKPLAVIWLCHRDHMRHHAMLEARKPKESA